MSRRVPTAAQPVRPMRKLRRYSITCARASHDVGIWRRTSRPAITLLPLMARTVPPAATTRLGSSMKGWVTRTRASGSSTESASVMTTISWRAALMPTLIASDRPELVLETTSRGVWPLRGTRTVRTSARTGISPEARCGTSTRSKASVSTRRVASVLPSSTMTTSCCG